MILGISYAVWKLVCLTMVFIITSIHSYYFLVSDHEAKTKRYIISLFLCGIVFWYIISFINIYAWIALAYILTWSLFYIFLDNRLDD